MDDAELVALALDGSTQAFDALVDRYYEACHRFAWRLLDNSHDAEDVVQETFLRAYRHLGSFRQSGSFRAWLYRILLNRVRTFARRSRWRSERVSTDGEAVAAAASPTRAESVELKDLLQQGLAGLQPSLREALLLKLGEGLAYEEMAELTGASVSALKMRVARARQMLRLGLEHDRT
jgi:RNA polymerase sigma-70 factor (ECF subfamily)